MHTLTVNSDNPFAEIAVFDSRLQVVGTGLGIFEMKLSPGIYKVQVSAGNKIYNELIEFNENRVVEITSDQVGFGDFSIPIGKSEKSLQIGKIAEKLSKCKRQPNLRGQLFLFISSYFSWDNNIEMSNHISLCGIDGVTIRAFPELFVPYDKSASDFWCSGIVIPLSAGNYRLKIKFQIKIKSQIVIKSQEVEQNIYISENVQTQVFFSMNDQNIIDILSMSISQSVYPDLEFISSKKEMQYEACELAKDILSHPEITVAPFHAEKMANGKMANPFLGIYSAHILIKQDKLPERINFISAIYKKTFSLLGEHPDVMIIGLWLKKNDKEFDSRDKIPRSFKNPPMLKASWDILVELSKEDPDLIPIDSFLALTTNCLMHNGSWYTWLYNEEIKSFDDVDIANTIYKTQNEELLPKLYAKLIESDSLTSVINDHKLSALESKIINLVDNELPIQFLDTLANFINKNHVVKDENEIKEIKEEVTELIRYITPDITKLLKKTLPYYSNIEKKEMIELIIRECEFQNIEIIKNNISQINPVFIGTVDNSISTNYFNELSFSRSLADQLNSSSNSVSIALNGISRKLNLEEPRNMDIS